MDFFVVIFSLKKLLLFCYLIFISCVLFFSLNIDNGFCFLESIKIIKTMFYIIAKFIA